MKFSNPRPPRRYSDQKRPKLLRPKAIFWMIFFEIFRYFVPPFALVRFRLDWSRDVNSITLIPLKPSDLVVSFSIVEKYTVEYAWEMCYSKLQKVADPKKNISIHKILFVGEECPIKKKRKKRWINFVLERRKMWVPGNKFCLRIQVQQYRCLNLDVNCYNYFPLFTYIN